MKKLLTLLLALILSLSVLVTLVACGGGDGDNGGDNTADGGNQSGDNGGANNGGDNGGGNTGGNQGGNTGGNQGGNTGGEGGGNAGGESGGNQGGESGGNQGGNDYSQYLNEDGELILFDGGKPTFKFVVASDAATVRQDIDTLASTLSSLGTKTVKVENAASSSVEAVEILIGSVNNRGDEYKYNKYDLGMQGYVVKQIGSKIIVQGGSTNALTTAINHLKSTVFGLKKTNDDFEDFAMASATNKEYIQTGYDVTGVTIAGDTIKNYTITYDNNTQKKFAEALQTRLYSECGIRVEIGRDASATGKKLAILSAINTGVGDGFTAKVDENGNLTIVCEIAVRFEETLDSFFNSYIFDQRGIASIEAGLDYSQNIRKIYYNKNMNTFKGDPDIAATGSGTADDFFALQAIHAYANEHLLDVHADPNGEYYIGNANGSQSIVVKTNTYFKACKFIFDDEGVLYSNYNARSANIFKIERDVKETKYYENTEGKPINYLASGATNVGFAPGFEALLIVQNSNQRRYHRFGANEDNGQIQQEIVYVDADGNVDPSTPVQWEYEAITYISVCRVDDRPIVIKGEDADGNLTQITTYFNDAPGSYFYYGRNFGVTRSNLVMSGIEHKFDSYVPYEDGGEGAPYNGFICTNDCNNVLYENCIFERPPTYKDDSSIRPSGMPNITNGSMGSYEISAGTANNITWKNCKQSNFFLENGMALGFGGMGTNECKNLTFDGMFFGRFDAHRGVYNVTMKNSVCERFNFIGDGKAIIENCEVYVDSEIYAVINHRADYGSTWWGTLDVDGLIVKYHKDHKAKDQIALAKSTWNNWDFFYQTSMAQYITIKNVVTAEYDFKLDGGVRDEWITGYNKVPLNLYSKDMDLHEDVYRNDNVNGQFNLNKMIPVNTIEISTVYTGKYAELGITNEFRLQLPKCPGGLYNEMTVIIDGTTYKYTNLPSGWIKP